MSTLGVSRSGRVRKKSAKVVEMENFGGEGAVAEDGGGRLSQASGGVMGSQLPTLIKQQPYHDSSGNESSSQSPQSMMSPGIVARRSLPPTPSPGGRRQLVQGHGNSMNSPQMRQNLSNNHSHDNNGGHLSFNNQANFPGNQVSCGFNQLDRRYRPSHDFIIDSRSLLDL